jgi:hypothetical protein
MYQMSVDAILWRLSMSGELNQSHLRLLTLLLLGSLLFFTGAKPAKAAELASNNEPQSSASQTATQESTTQTEASAKADGRSPQAASVIVHTSDNRPAGSVTPDADGSGQTSASSTPPAPLTPRQKFNYSLRSSFKPPTPYGLSVFSGLFSEATDNDHHRHMTAGDFLADSMTHAARSFAFRVTANFFEKFAYAAAFHQDPRYFRSDKKGFARITYALSRVVITTSDSGHNQFNAAFFAGGLTTAAISNVWSRPEDRALANTMSRFGLHVAYRGLSNIIKELFGKP